MEDLVPRLPRWSGQQGLPLVLDVGPALIAERELGDWRNDELQVLDAGLRRRKLAQVPSQEETDFPSDMHLDGVGTLAFTLGNDLWTTESPFRPFHR